MTLYRQEKKCAQVLYQQTFEFDYMLKGVAQYTIGDKKYVLNLWYFYYDARQPHLSECLSDDEYVMLVIYFLTMDKLNNASFIKCKENYESLVL